VAMLVDVGEIRDSAEVKSEALAIEAITAD
jgi:hypothetical protein